ncbi:ComEA family DNA-binding protein [Psychromonas sp. Urea-02u-13]|uniref:ComEA family DNA-binding protein n=1 Tax=Psychromonas sp. Urea-02u-13 TaxID=2058326 RepID=UPI000C3293F7|nr:helix-hairpin-helix domain-containing protein [Psychromonas sp. Urea-02u-13]PKG39272.1 competence protein ComEA [Psychromonas sp. Urea-02u-13]
MLKIFTYRLLLVASLFLLSTSTQVLATEKVLDVNSAIEVSEKININQAGAKELAAIKGIGTKKAQAIIEYRETNGDFVSVEELVKVKGIGKGTLKKIAPFISL